MSKQMTGYPSIDKPWMKYYSEHDSGEYAKDESMFQMLERCNESRMNEIAIDMRSSENHFKKGITITYREFIQRIKNLAAALSNVLSIQANEIVPIIIPNLPESRIIIYALNILGATVYPINPMLSVADFKKILEENNVKNIAIFSGFWEKFGSNITNNSSVEHILWVDGYESMSMPVKAINRIKRNAPDDDRILFYDDVLKNRKSKDVEPYYSEDHVAIIIGTSGTTGTSKGVCIPDCTLNAMAEGQSTSGYVIAGDTVLDILIQSIGYGISSMHTYNSLGCKVVIVPELVTNNIAELVCAVKPDFFPGGPVHYINLANSDEINKGLLPKIKGPFSGGATLDKDIEKKLNPNADEGYMEKTGDVINVRQGYGSTECCGVATANAYGAYKFGSIGIPMANVVLGVFEPGTDQELPYGEVGEICVSGPTVMSGYLNNKEETEKVLKVHSDGKVWLHQADLGWCDEDGHFFFTDRIKNIFMRTGFNVHPSTITAFIQQNSAVKDCIVVGVPHPEQQMVPVAFVVLNELSEEDTVKDVLIQECFDNLNETDIPFEWFFVEMLPRNMGGKVDTQALIKNCNVNYSK